MQEPEPLALMGEISDALSEAGWKRVPYKLTSGGVTYGDERPPAYGIKRRPIPAALVSIPAGRSVYGRRPDKCRQLQMRAG